MEHAKQVTGEINATGQVLKGDNITVFGSGNTIYGNYVTMRGDGNTGHGTHIDAHGAGNRIIGDGTIDGTGWINDVQHSTGGQSTNTTRQPPARAARGRPTRGRGRVRGGGGGRARVMRIEPEIEQDLEATAEPAAHASSSDDSSDDERAVAIRVPPESDESKDEVATGSQKMCEICCENVIKCVNIPCGHAVSCIKCSRKLAATQNGKRCINCRQELTQINLLFI